MGRSVSLLSFILSDRCDSLVNSVYFLSVNKDMATNTANNRWYQTELFPLATISLSKKAPIVCIFLLSVFVLFFFEEPSSKPCARLCTSGCSCFAALDQTYHTPSCVTQEINLCTQCCDVPLLYFARFTVGRWPFPFWFPPRACI